MLLDALFFFTIKSNVSPEFLLNQCILSSTLTEITTSQQPPSLSPERKPSQTYLSQLLSLSGQELALSLPPGFIAAERQGKQDIKGQKVKHQRALGTG